jgi:hypothetical protein
MNPMTHERLITSVVDTSRDSFDCRSIETVVAAISAKRSAEILAAQSAGLQLDEARLRFLCGADPAAFTAFLTASGITAEMLSKPYQQTPDDDDAEDDEHQATLRKLAAATMPEAPGDLNKATKRLAKECAKKPSNFGDGTRRAYPATPDATSRAILARMSKRA